MERISCSFYNLILSSFCFTKVPNVIKVLATAEKTQRPMTNYSAHGTHAIFNFSSFCQSLLATLEKASRVAMVEFAS